MVDVSTIGRYCPCVPVVSVEGGGGGGGSSRLRSAGRGVGESPVSVVAVAAVSVDAGDVSREDAVLASSADVEVSAGTARGRRVILMRSGTGPPFAVAVFPGSVPAIDAVDVLPAGVGFPREKLVVVSTAVLVDVLVATVAVPSPMLEVTVPLAPS